MHRAAGAITAGAIALPVIVGVTVAAGTLIRAFPVFATLLGLAVPARSSPAGLGVAAGTVLVASLLGAALAPRASDAPWSTAVLAVALLGIVGSAWVSVLGSSLLPVSSGPPGDLGLASDKGALFAAGYVTVALGSVLPLALLWAWSVRHLAIR